MSWAWLPCAAVALASCVTSGQVRERSAAVEARLSPIDDAARACAPEALARARAELAMAQRSSEIGDGLRAALHLTRAERWADEACAPAHLEACAAAGAAQPEASAGSADDDGDGVPNAEDRCPDEREDRDGWLDHDGCPEADNDGDGISDDIDQCPDEAEDQDGFEDIDGCPEVGGRR